MLNNITGKMKIYRLKKYFTGLGNRTLGTLLIITSYMFIEGTIGFDLVTYKS